MNLDQLLLQEKALEFAHFSHQTAWDLGEFLYREAVTRHASIAIEVYAFGQVLFSHAMQGTAKDQQYWIEMKRNSVLRYGRSTRYLGEYNQSKGRVFEDLPHIDAKTYCAHGGSLPIRLKNSGVIGAITAAGLASDDDHDLVVQAIKYVQEKEG